METEIDDCNICDSMIYSNQEFIRLEDNNMESITVHNSCQNTINSKNKANKEIISRLDESIITLENKINIHGKDLQFSGVEVLQELHMIQSNISHKSKQHKSK